MVSVRVVNMIPRALSFETNQDSEPNLAVNPANPLQIAGSAFTPDPFGGPNAPIFVSADGGQTWLANSIVPGPPGQTTSDITVRFASASNILYAGILRRPGTFRLNILRTTNFLGPTAMTVLVDRSQVDQPYVQAVTVAGRDRVYVGDNDFAAPGGRTATIDQSLDASIAAPVFNSVRIEARTTPGQDAPPIRVAVGSDQTVYAAFYGWRRFSGNFTDGFATTDVVVVRDDAGGTGANPFTALVDTDGRPGKRVVLARTVPWANHTQANFGQERFVGSNLSIAVDPNHSATVYVAWADRVGQNDYTLHVRRSVDRGVTWSTADLRTITNATNPALAINTSGQVGFLYQQLLGTGAAQRWSTRLELTTDGFLTRQEFVLADVPATTPPIQFLPYLGDYVHLQAVGTDFYGIFAANNTPDLANFPSGVTYQRNADFATHTLLDNNNRPVPISIDPFFVHVRPDPTGPVFEYAAKVVCGLQADPADQRLARALYTTTINVHNPSDRPVTLFKKLALTYPPEEQRPGPIFPIGTDTLGPDEALSTDCVDLRKRVFPKGWPTPYVEGFLIIESPESLDVTAVYSTAALDRGGRPMTHSSIEVEQIRERRKGQPEALADLVPVPDASGSFCRGEGGKLLVTVKNQGVGPAGPSTTEVDFFAFGKVALPTPPLPPNTSVDLLFPIPRGCFDPDCEFRITVDAKNEVAESNEANNTATGACIG